MAAEDSADDIQSLVDQAMAEAQGESDAIAQTQGTAVGVEDPQSDSAGDHFEAVSGLELLGDVDLQVKIELGRTQMLVEDVLKLGEGSVVELDKLAGDPVDVYVNNRLVARGEVLVLNDNFCIRISEIVANLEKQAEAVAEAAVAESSPEGA